MSNELLQEARSLLIDMKDQAEQGTMIPFRIPGQIDDIIDLLDQADDDTLPVRPDALTESATAATVLDVAAGMQEQLEETSQFISIAVHEMRIPLTSIRGYSDMLAKQILGELNDQQMQFMDTIRTNVMRMDRLIADVNDVAKIRAKRLHMDIKMDMPKNILMGVEKDTADLAQEKEITLVFEVPDGLPLLNVDSGRVTQALRYMVENALHYSPNGSTVTVTASNDEGRFRVAVMDEGIGMTEEEQEHLGEPFWRSDHEVIRSVKGHGLGYAVAKGVIELHEGAMFYETVFEKGSTFGFTLPTLS